MTHNPIQISHLSLSFPHKTCFDDFSVTIQPGDRIAITGRNGCGKSTLLKMIQGTIKTVEGTIQIPNNLTIGYVPQIISEFDSLSGGQRFNAALTRALSNDPSVFLLDEPTNHLDHRNRQSLFRMLKAYSGTLIIVSHDTELLRTYVDTLWHIEQGKIHVFSGNYDDFQREITIKKSSLELEYSHLNRQKKNLHESLMKEQVRASKSKKKGKKSIDQHKWPTIVSTAKAGRAQETSGHKRAALDQKKQKMTEHLQSLQLPEILTPKFSLSAADIGNRPLLSITDGAVGYLDHKPLLETVNLSLSAAERIALVGNNGSGKTTLIRAILGYSDIQRSGQWFLPKPEDIGYLDQHYATLYSEKSVFETISELVPSWSHADIRRHLNDFLFRKNEEVNSLVKQLSGGEKARLALAQIAAKTPKLLILDEITNNLDLETKSHIVTVLNSYPGALIVISHESDFLQEINVEEISIARFK